MWSTKREESPGRTVSVWLTAVGNGGHECGALGDTTVHIISVLDMEQKSEDITLLFTDWELLSALLFVDWGLLFLASTSGSFELRIFPYTGRETGSFTLMGWNVAMASEMAGLWKHAGSAKQGWGVCLLGSALIPYHRAYFILKSSSTSVCWKRLPSQLKTGIMIELPAWKFG